MFMLTACATAPSTESVTQSESHMKLGSFYFSNGQVSEAYAEYQKAAIANPKNKEALNQLGYLSALFQKYDDAVMYYKRAISVDPDYSDAMNNLGVLYLELKNWDESITYFKRAVANPLYRSPERAYSSMGYAYYRKGDYALAEKYIKDAMLRNPSYPVANYYMGLLYVKHGNDEAAIKEFEKAVGIMQEYMDVHWELAQAYLRVGEKSKALRHFRVIAEQDSDRTRSREALEYIEVLK